MKKFLGAAISVLLLGSSAALAGSTLPNLQQGEEVTGADLLIARQPGDTADSKISADMLRRFTLSGGFVDPRDSKYGTGTCTGYYKITSHTFNTGGSGWQNGDRFYLYNSVIQGNVTHGTVTGVSTGAVTSYTLDTSTGSYHTGTGVVAIPEQVRVDTAGTGYAKGDTFRPTIVTIDYTGQTGEEFSTGDTIDNGSSGAALVTAVSNDTGAGDTSGTLTVKYFVGGWEPGNTVANVGDASTATISTIGKSPSLATWGLVTSVDGSGGVTGVRIEGEFKTDLFGSPFPTGYFGIGVNTKTETGDGSGLTMNVPYGFKVDIDSVGGGVDDRYAFEAAMADAARIGAAVLVPNGCWVSQLHPPANATLLGMTEAVQYAWGTQKTPNLFAIGAPPIFIDFSNSANFAMKNVVLNGVYDANTNKETSALASMSSNSAGDGGSKVFIANNSFRNFRVGFGTDMVRMDYSGASAHPVAGDTISSGNVAINYVQQNATEFQVAENICMSTTSMTYADCAAVSTNARAVVASVTGDGTVNDTSGVLAFNTISSKLDNIWYSTYRYVIGETSGAQAQWKRIYGTVGTVMKVIPNTASMGQFWVRPEAGAFTTAHTSVRASSGATFAISSNPASAYVFAVSEGNDFGTSWNGVYGSFSDFLSRADTYAAIAFDAIHLTRQAGGLCRIVEPRVEYSRRGIVLEDGGTQCQIVSVQFDRITGPCIEFRNAPFNQAVGGTYKGCGAGGTFFVKRAYDNGNGKVRLDIGSYFPNVILGSTEHTQFMETGDKVTITGVIGTTEANVVGGVITVVDFDTIDLEAVTFTNAFKTRIAYSGQSATDFTVGETITAEDGVTAVVEAISDDTGTADTTGVLTLNTVSGNFSTAGASNGLTGGTSSSTANVTTFSLTTSNVYETVSGVWGKSSYITFGAVPSRNSDSHSVLLDSIMFSGYSAGGTNMSPMWVVDTSTQDYHTSQNISISGIAYQGNRSGRNLSYQNAFSNFGSKAPTWYRWNVIGSPGYDSITPKLDCFAGFPLTGPAEALPASGTTNINSYVVPAAFVVTSVYANLRTAGGGAALATVDVNEGGTSILSTKLTFDAGETATSTAATPTVISDTALAAGAVISFDVDTKDTDATAAGLSVSMCGYYPNKVDTASQGVVAQ